MTRDAFLRILRSGLTGLSPQDIDDILSDYVAHFAESVAAGRAESDVAAALGDPARLAREVRAEVGLRRLDAHWSLRNIMVALIALIGLAIVDILVLLPLLMATIVIALGLAIVLAIIGATGIKILVASALFDPGATVMSTLSRMFIGAGLTSCLVGGGALLLLAMAAGIRLCGRYARLHFHLVQPGHDRVRPSATPS